MKKLILTLVALVVAVFAAQAKLPSVQLKDINGKTVNAASLSNDGKPLAIIFYSRGCGPCRGAIDAIGEEYAKWQKETGVKLVVIYIPEFFGPVDDYSEYEQAAKNFMDKKLSCKYDLFFDYNKLGEYLIQKLGATSIPYIILMDGNGNIVYSKTGWSTSKNEAEKRELYNKLRSIPSIEPVNSKIRTKRN